MKRKLTAEIKLVIFCLSHVKKVEMERDDELSSLETN
jgi:hypothetical protein